MKYFTSDLHINHLNVINYCNRPYKDCDEMNLAIIAGINAKVTANDELYILGDFSLSPKWVEWGLQLINCKNIHLIIGNHDSCFERKLGAKPEKTKKMRERYLKAGFKTLTYKMEVEISKQGHPLLRWFQKKYKVMLCHFPFLPDGVNNTDARYLTQRPEDKGQILLHGHSHCRYVKNGRMIDVGFDHKFEPYSEAELVDLIEDKRDYIPSRITEYYKSRKDELVNKEEY